MGLVKHLRRILVTDQQLEMRGERGFLSPLLLYLAKQSVKRCLTGK